MKMITNALLPMLLSVLFIILNHLDCAAAWITNKPISSRKISASISPLFSHQRGITPSGPGRGRIPSPNNENNGYSSKIDFVDKRDYWVFMYYLLMVFQQREGHVDVPLHHPEQGWPLGQWLSGQRELYKRQQLDPLHQNRLAQAGVAWDLQHRTWEKRMELLRRFQQREGHAHVPQRHVEDGYPLGTWLNTQRAAYRQGKMTITRQKQLEELGVVWNHQTATWNRMISLLENCRDREGHVQVPLRHVVVQGNTTSKLGTWLASQRKFWKAGTLAPERQEQLQALGVVVQDIQNNGGGNDDIMTEYQKESSDDEKIK